MPPVYDYSDSETPIFNWQSTLSTLLDQGVNPRKINMGMPFYGRGVVTEGTASLGAGDEKAPGDGAARRLHQHGVRFHQLAP